MNKQKKTIRIVIKGEEFTLEEAKTKFKSLSLVANPTANQILLMLAKAEKPLTVNEIAESIQKSGVYIHNILNDLILENLVARFRLGTRVFYHALTEKGYNVAKDFSKSVQPS